MSRRRGWWCCLLWFLVGAGSLVAQSDPPVNYYDAAIGKTGTQLKAALHEIIKGHVQFPYTYTGSSPDTLDTWDVLKSLDQDPANASNVLLIYSGYSHAKSAQASTSSGTWNREHLWPQSYGLDAINANGFGKTDVFNLRPADVNVNSSRGNKYYDTTTLPGSSHPEAPLCTYDGDSWEPRVVERGDIARTMFYMAVRYEGDASDKTPNLELSDSPSDSLYRFGKLSTFLSWNRLYPVNATERTRNHRIYTDYQHNRNPFVDHPEFADMVFSSATPAQAWKNVRFTATELSNTTVSGDLADPDADGLRNVVEYVFLRNPRQPDASPLFNVSKNADGSLQLVYSRNRFATDVTVSYEVSTNGLTWSLAAPQVLGTVASTFEREQVTVKIPGSGPEVLVRLKLVRP